MTWEICGVQFSATPAEYRELEQRGVIDLVKQMLASGFFEVGHCDETGDPLFRLCSPGEQVAWQGDIGQVN